jgi:hypothetical protein
MYRFSAAINLLVLGILLYRFSLDIASGEAWYLFKLLMIISGSASIASFYTYIKSFKKNALYLFHGAFFLLLALLSAAHFADYYLERESLGAARTVLSRLVYMQFLAAVVLAVPAAITRLREHRAQIEPAGRWYPEVIALYAFSAIFPVQHYIVNNLDSFSFGLMIQFALIAGLIPVAIFFVLHFYARVLTSEHEYFLINLVSAVAVFSFYMRPLFRQFSIMFSEAIGIELGAFVVHAPLFILLFTLGYKFRSALAPFLSLVLLLALGNLGYTVYIESSARVEPIESTVSGEVIFKKRPSVYILVADGYENRKSLSTKGFAHLDIGPDLFDRGFRVYENAHSNYKPSVPSLTSFFNLEHHYYRDEPGWEDVLTGTSKLYSAFKSNEYHTVVAHPTDYLLRGSCKSDLCYPAPGLFGQISFLLAQTIFYRTDFTTPTAVGLGKYNDDFIQIIERTVAPSVVYSHYVKPGHSPRGCSDLTRVLKVYGERLVVANEWIDRTVEKIESIDDEAIILVLGDHGAMTSGNCNWSEPDVTSREAIGDNLGILMAVKWPQDYDNRYDDDIHTLIDLSWYLLQYLSEDSMDEVEKARSESFLIRESEDLVYKVVENGVVITSSNGFSNSDMGSAVPPAQQIIDTNSHNEIER